MELSEQGLIPAFALHVVPPCTHVAFGEDPSEAVSHVAEQGVKHEDPGVPVALVRVRLADRALDDCW